MAKILIAGVEHEVHEDVKTVLDNLKNEVARQQKEVNASRKLISAATVAMQPMTDLLPLLVDGESESVNGMELLTQLGKLKSNSKVKASISELKNAQLEYANVMRQLNG